MREKVLLTNQKLPPKHFFFKKLKVLTFPLKRIVFWSQPKSWPQNIFSEIKNFNFSLKIYIFSKAFRLSSTDVSGEFSIYERKWHTKKDNLHSFMNKIYFTDAPPLIPYRNSLQTVSINSEKTIFMGNKSISKVQYFGGYIYLTKFNLFMLLYFN